MYENGQNRGGGDNNGDNGNAKIYYYNVFTKEVRWEKPAETKKDSIPLVVGKHKSKKSRGRQSSKEAAGDNKENNMKEEVQQIIGKRSLLNGTEKLEEKHQTTEKFTTKGLSILKNSFQGFSNTHKNNSTTIERMEQEEEVQVPPKRNEKDENTSKASVSSNGSSKSPKRSSSSLFSNKSDEEHQYHSLTVIADDATRIMIRPPSQDDNCFTDSVDNGDKTITMNNIKEEESGQAHSTEITNTVSAEDEPGQIVRVPEHDRLRNLLFTYCYDETENNNQLLSKAHGREAVIIHDLQNLIDNTPFDELRLVIFNFVKETLRGMGELPFDENNSLQQQMLESMSAKHQSDLDAATNDTSQSFAPPAAPYSMNSVSSTITGRSIISSSTQAMNNTSKFMGRDPSQPYSMNAKVSSVMTGRSNMSSSTEMISNTTKTRQYSHLGDDLKEDGAIIRSVLNPYLEKSNNDKRGLLVTTSEDDKITTFYEDLTETEDEEFGELNESMDLKERIIVDLEMMEVSDKLDGVSEKTEIIAEKTKPNYENNEEEYHDDESDYLLQNALDALEISGEQSRLEGADFVLKKSNSAENISDGDEEMTTELSTGNFPEMRDNDTIESAYAADYDDLSHEEYSFDDHALDDISALSDSVDRNSLRRRKRERKKEKSTNNQKNTEKEKSIRKVESMKDDHKVSCCS